MSSIETPVAVPRQGLPRAAMGLFAIVGFAAIQAGGAAPTPVYRIYQEVFSVSPTELIFIFAMDPLSLLVALLTVGSLSDHVGRRPVLFWSMLLNVVAMLVFLNAHSATVLIAARIVQGLATGAASSTLGAAMLDTNQASGSLINTVTAFTGTTIGALLAGALVTYAPAPTQLVYLIFPGDHRAGSGCLGIASATGRDSPSSTPRFPFRLAGKHRGLFTRRLLPVPSASPISHDDRADLALHWRRSG